jgi:hypothetical protein
MRPPYGSTAWLPEWSSPEARDSWLDCSQKQPVSRSPWETGVVWSPTGEDSYTSLLKQNHTDPIWVYFSGPLTAGTMMAGLAGGLQPQTVTWEAGNVDNGWAASLAGDLAQTAITKRKEEPFIGRTISYISLFVSHVRIPKVPMASSTPPFARPSSICAPNISRPFSPG